MRFTFCRVGPGGLFRQGHSRQAKTHDVGSEENLGTLFAYGEASSEGLDVLYGGRPVDLGRSRRKSGAEISP